MVNPLMQEPLMEQSLPSGEHFTSITHTTLDNSHFVFAGTNSGKLYQVRQGSSFDLITNLVLIMTVVKVNFNSKLSRVNILGVQFRLECKGTKI